MLLKVPFCYEAEVIKLRCKNSLMIDFGDWIEVEINEATSSEAPVALRWIDGSKHSDIPHIKETRWFNGNHYMPVFDYEDTAEKYQFQRESLFNACEVGSPLSFALPIDHAHFLQNVLSGNLQPLNEDNFKAVLTSTHDEKVSRILQRAQELLVVDGGLWRACSEPIYLLKQGEGLVVHIPNNSDPAYSAERKFRIDRLDDAIHHFGIENDRWIRDRADVLIPESVCFDDEIPAIMHAAKREVDRQRDSLDKLPTDVLLAWGCLRDATVLAEKDPNPTNVEDVVKCFQVIIKISEIHPSYSRDAERALERWSLRPLYAAPYIGDDAAIAP